MVITDLKCPNCGAVLNLYKSIGRAYCESCGSNFLIENAGENDSYTNNDSPVGYKIERDDGANAITLCMQEFGDEEREVVVMQPYAMDMYIPLYAGLSLILGKSYKITAYCGCEEVAAEFDKAFLKLMKKDNRELIYTDMCRDCSNNEMLLTSIIKWCDAHGFKTTVEEQKAKKSISYQTRYSSTQEYDSTTKSVKAECVITPGYLGKYYQNVLTAYESIRQKNEVRMIADECLKIMHSDSNERFKIYLSDDGIEITRLDINPPRSNKVLFNSFGMDRTPNEAVLVAVFIAVFEKICSLSQKNGHYTWDIGEEKRSIRYIGYRSELSRTGKATEDKTLFFIIKHTEKLVKLYNSWI